MANFLDYVLCHHGGSCFETPSQEPFWPRQDYLFIKLPSEFLCYVLHRPQNRFHLYACSLALLDTCPAIQPGFFFWRAVCRRSDAQCDGFVVGHRGHMIAKAFRASRSAGVDPFRSNVSLLISWPLDPTPKFRAISTSSAHGESVSCKKG